MLAASTEPSPLAALISATDEKAIQDALDTMVEGAKAAVE